MGHTYKKYKNIFGLTTTELKMFADSWVVLNEHLGHFGVILILIFYEKYPEHINTYFPKLKNLSNIEELRATPTVTLQGLKIMRQLSMMADFIDNQEMLIQTVNRHVLYHSKRNITKEAYCAMKECILEMLSRHLKSSGVVLQTWNKIISGLIEMIFAICSRVDE